VERRSHYLSFLEIHLNNAQLERNPITGIASAFVILLFFDVYFFNRFVSPSHRSIFVEWFCEGLPNFKISQRVNEYIDETIASLEGFLGNNIDPNNQKTPIDATLATSLQVWKLVRALWGRHKKFDGNGPH
jgi:hypothetical protein